MSASRNQGLCLSARVSQPSSTFMIMYTSLMSANPCNRSLLALLVKGVVHDLFWLERAELALRHWSLTVVPPLCQLKVPA